MLLTDGTFRYTADMCCWRLYCWHVLLTDGRFSYTSDICYWLMVPSGTLLICAADGYTADMCYWLIYVQLYCWYVLLADLRSIILLICATDGSYVQLHCWYVLLTVILLICATDWSYLQLHCWYVLLTDCTFSYIADMCCWRLHCWHVLLTVTLLICATDWSYLQLQCWYVLLTDRTFSYTADMCCWRLHCWYVLVTDRTFSYTADMCYWLTVSSVTLLTYATDWQRYSYNADVCHWLYVIHKKSNTPQSAGSSLPIKTAINRSLCLLLSVLSQLVLFHAVMLLRTLLSSSPSFFLHCSTSQAVLLPVCTHNFMSNRSCNCGRNCVTAHHELMVDPVRIRRLPGADNCSVLFRISVDICEPAANSLKCVNNVQYPFQTPDKRYMYPCANIKAYGGGEI